LEVQLALSPNDIAAVQELWREYWQSFGLPPDFQGFAGELATLPGVYAPPEGALLLARIEGCPAGTIALRPLTPSSAEVKRLYLRPKYRGFGLGKRLLEAVFERSHGAFDYLYADTLPEMKEALSLYLKLGFERTEPYSDTPTPGAIYLKRKLL
jgi:putative acetyltransferase